MIVTEDLWCYVNIGSDSKPLTEPVLTQITRPHWAQLHLGLTMEQSAKYNIAYTVAIANSSTHHSWNPQKSLHDKFPSRPNSGVSILSTLLKILQCILDKSTVFWWDDTV